MTSDYDYGDRERVLHLDGYPESVVVAAVNDYLLGSSQRAVAAKHGIARVTLGRWLDRYGVAKRRDGDRRTPDQYPRAVQDEAVAAMASGSSIREISEGMRLDPAVIGVWARLHGYGFLVADGQDDWRRWYSDDMWR